MKSCLLLALGTAFSTVASGDLVLAERERPAACTIVRAADASPSEVYAAEELRDHLARVTGVTLAIATDADALPAKAVVVGATRFSQDLLDAKRLGEDGFRLVAKDGRLYVSGSRKRGALYGVYELLERYAGCRWYASWHAVVPTRARVAVPENLDVTETPAFAMREPFWHDVLQHPAFAARIRANSLSWRPYPEKFGGNSFRFGGGLGSCHTFNTLLPPDKYFDAHPEYFSFENGHRVKNPTQLCLTNPDVLRLVTEEVLRRIRKDPGAKFYGVSQNDWRHYCQCPKCKAVDDEEESHAGTVIRFVNAVAAAVEKEFPEVIIETLAYQYTRKPPRKTKLRHNVVPCLCTIECDFARPLDVSQYKDNISFRRDIEGWSRQTDQLYVWDYVTDFPNYTMPFANVLALQGNLKFFRANHVREMFEQGAYQGRHGDFAELKAWLLAKWMWNPDLPAEPLLQDFFTGYYGKGAPFVRQYFDELHAAQIAYSTPSNRPLSIWVGPHNPAISDAFLEKAAGLWAQAIAATKDDRTTSYNVRMGAFGVDYMRLERMRGKNDKVLWLASETADVAAFARTRALAKSLLARMDEAKDIRLAESMDRHKMFVKEWKALVARPEPVAAGGAVRGTVEDEWIVAGRPGEWCARVADPKAGDGKAIKLLNTHYEWCLTFRMDRVAFEPGVPYLVRVRARCEKASDGEAFWAGVYDPVAKTGRGEADYTTAQVGEDYAWYDVCTWVPNENEYFWMGPGRFKKQDGKSAIKVVWLDKIEFVRAGFASAGPLATLELDSRGRVVRLDERGTGRALVGKVPQPFAVLETAKGKVVPQSVAATEDGLDVWFGKAGRLVLGVSAFRGGWTFTVKAATFAKDVVRVRFACGGLDWGKYLGTMALLVSDDASGVCLRDYGVMGKPVLERTYAGVSYAADASLAGKRFGLVAAPRAEIQNALRVMTLESGVPHSDCGGAWSLGAPKNRLSYLMAGVTAATADDWVAVAQRAGVGILHFDGGTWGGRWGWYEPVTNRFPRGVEDMRDVSAAAHAAGLLTSFHTLTGGVHPSCPWVNNPIASNLVVCHTYTLARPIPANGPVPTLYVNEKPASDHGYNFRLWSRGNTIRVGNELFQYTNIVFTAPYAFTGVTRARFGTVPAAHPAGAKADYLWAFFGQFLAEPETPLADALAGRIRRIYDCGGFDMLYLDGADGYGHWPHRLSAIVREIYASAATNGSAPLYEDSVWSSASWWFHSRIGAYDYTRLAAKSFTDNHVRRVMTFGRRDNLLEVNLGWWPILTGRYETVGYMPDDVEYFGGKCAAYDASFSLPLGGIGQGHPLGTGALDQVTRLGWYERFRMARAFSDEALAALRPAGVEHRLRQDATGRWTLTPASVCVKTMNAPDDRAWNVTAPVAGPAALRIRARSAAGAYVADGRGAVLTAQDVPTMQTSSAVGVEAALAAGTGEKGATLRLTVANASAAEAKAAWGCARKTWPRPFFNFATACPKARTYAVGFWLKGDASGATANVQFRTPSEISGAINEHYVKLDFTGWKYFAFSVIRDHAAGSRPDLRWPYEPPASPNYPLYERMLTASCVEAASVWLINVPKGKTASVEVSAVEILPEEPIALGRAAVTLNGVEFVLPFALKSDEYAELDEGFWTRYALDSTPLERAPAKGVPQVKSGANAVSVTFAEPRARAEVTLQTFGKPFAALKTVWTPQTHRQLAYEADLPRTWFPAKGFDTLAPVRVRPGETAQLEIELAGPIGHPQLTLGGETWTFPISLAANERLQMTDGRHWRVTGYGTPKVRASGTLARPLMRVQGELPVALAGEPGKTPARLDLVKRY